LHRSAGLSDDPETLTKQEIIDSIISARDDLTELPPSSPYGAGTNSSECSSDDGNIAGGEETDAGSQRRSHPLGSRRPVAQNVAHAPNLAAPQLGRSFSLGHTRALPAPTGVSCQIETRSVDLFQSRELTDNKCRRRAASLRSSPTTSTASGFLPSPPATRLRSRKVSGEDGSVASTLRPIRSRGKAKHVVFNEQVQVANVETLSDLTDLSDAEPCSPPINPSPRRLRSQGGKTVQTPPKRESKKKISNSGQDDDDVDDEVDELDSSRDVTPPPVIPDRTPVKRRLRPRQTQTHTPPDESDDGDDEEEEEVEEEGDEGVTEDAVSVDIAEEEDGDDAEEDDATLVEPRKLRNGKIVGEEEGLEAVYEQEGSEESTQEEIPVDEEIDLEAEDDESEESSHDEFAEEAMDDGE
jgi:mitogen-activated protein kinase kinase kinase 13